MKLSSINQPIYIHQQGAALMVMMIILVLGTAGLLVSSLGGISQTIQRDQKTTEALNQAKESLIAYAATQGDIAGTPRPGDLPCPDTNNDGNSEGTCVAGAIGRLPYKTLGIAQLFDSHGESLWYSISGNFRIRSITGNNLNSDTNGTLDVYDSNGTTPFTSSNDKAVAVIFAPGAVVDTQDRSSSQTALCSTTSTTIARNLCAANYLEASNGRNNSTTNGPFIAGDNSSTFNDKLAYIKVSQFRHAIEKRVAGEIRNLLKLYYASWNAFPFAVTFNNPASVTYTGANGVTAGLIPLDSILGPNINEPEWNSTPTVTFSDGVNRLPFCELRQGNWNSSLSRWRCCKDSGCSNNVLIPEGVTVTITGRLNNIGKGFWEPYDINDNVNKPVRVRVGGTSYLATSYLDNVTVQGRLIYSNGNAEVVFTGTGKAGGTTLQRIELRDISNFASVFPNWFSQNNWQQLMYYTTSPGFAPGGGHNCSPYCVSINNTVASAVVVATSKNLSGQTHPSSTLSNYLEEPNLTHTAGAYSTGSVTDTFNDTVIAVSP